jgi:hypothetical protein
MSTADDITEHDTKAGYSSWCRRGEHRTCETVKARCSCPHHGAHGQQPPAPPTPSVKEPTMSTATAEVTPLRPPPDVEQKPTGGGHTCPDCGKTFAAPQGLGAHRSRAHGYRKAAPASKPPAAKREPAPKPTPKVEPENDQWLLVVGPVDTDQTAAVVVLSSEHDARQVAALLDTLGHDLHVSVWRAAADA